MNNWLMKLSLVVSIVVSISLAGSIFYQRRYVPSDDRQLPAIISELEAKLKTQSSKAEKFEATLSEIGSKIDREVQWLKEELKKLLKPN